MICQIYPPAQNWKLIKTCSSIFQNKASCWNSGTGDTGQIVKLLSNVSNGFCPSGRKNTHHSSKIRHHFTLTTHTNKHLSLFFRTFQAVHKHNFLNFVLPFLNSNSMAQSYWPTQCLYNWSYIFLPLHFSHTISLTWNDLHSLHLSNVHPFFKCLLAHSFIQNAVCMTCKFWECNTKYNSPLFKWEVTDTEWINKCVCVCIISVCVYIFTYIKRERDIK